MEQRDCPDCKRLFEAARDAIRTHIRAQGKWQLASLRREEPLKLEELRAAHEAAGDERAQAVSAYRAHVLTHGEAENPIA